MEYKAQVRHKLFTHGELNLRYAIWGEGRIPLLAFHGFGRSHSDFIRFTRPFGHIFTVYAFDIFFHGKSHIGKRSADGNPLSKNELKELIEAFLIEINREKICLMGYSLGGRICMTIAEVLPHRIEAMYLFAPDGLILNRWYALLSHYALGRSLFRYFKKHNAFFYRILNGLHSAKIISTRVKQFVTSQIATRELQEKVYQVWTFLRKIEPDFKKLGPSLRENETSVDLFFGLYDKIIPEKNAKRFKKVFPDLRIYTLRSGHILLTGANGELIARERMIQLPEKGKKAI